MKIKLVVFAIAVSSIFSLCRNARTVQLRLLTTNFADIERLENENG